MNVALPLCRLFIASVQIIHTARVVNRSVVMKVNVVAACKHVITNGVTHLFMFKQVMDLTCVTTC